MVVNLTVDRVVLILPIGLQVIGPPWREDLVLRVAAELKRNGTCAARSAV